MNNDLSSLSHAKWRCQYHIVFAPKYRRQEIYGKYKAEIGKILRTICEKIQCRNNSGRSLSRSYTYAGINTAENECIKIYGDIKR